MIRLPWVSRASYALACAERDAARFAGQQYATWYAASQARYDALLDKYHALRVQGANEPAPRAEPAKPDVVTQAVIAKAKNNLLLRKHYADHIAAQRASGVSEDEIAKGIMEGDSDETEGVA